MSDLAAETEARLQAAANRHREWKRLMRSRCPGGRGWLRRHRWTSDAQYVLGMDEPPSLEQRLLLLMWESNERCLGCGLRRAQAI